MIKGLKWLVINLIVLLTLLILADKFLFVFGIGYDESTEQRAIRLREHPLLTSTSLKTENAISLKTDSNGYILPHGGLNQGDKIIFVGGSTTECILVEENQRFPFLVGEFLKPHHIQSINAGVSGNHSFHSLNIILNKLLVEKPSFVVLMHNINDLFTYVRYHDYHHVTGKYSNIIQKTETEPNTFFRLFPSISKIIVDNFLTQNQYTQVNFDTNKEMAYRLQNDFYHNLKMIKQVCDLHDIKLVLMTQARAFKAGNPSEESLKNKNNAIFPSSFVSLFDKQNDNIRSFCHNNKVPLIDLADQFNERNDLFYDAVHYNKKGCREVAKCISQTFEPWLTSDSINTTTYYQNEKND